MLLMLMLLLLLLLLLHKLQRPQQQRQQCCNFKFFLHPFIRFKVMMSILFGGYWTRKFLPVIVAIFCLQGCKTGRDLFYSPFSFSLSPFPFTLSLSLPFHSLPSFFFLSLSFSPQPKLSRGGGGGWNVERGNACWIICVRSVLNCFRWWLWRTLFGHTCE